MSDQTVVDAPQRARALDPEHSFIVQAPAGSGKTGLITQRFLTLLARVNAPEEVVAITFTRKAAGEMRARILDALVGASGPEPADEHGRTTWRLARLALARDAAQGWRLLDNPARLAVQTIDSLCGWLTRQLPLLASFGAQPQVTEDGEALYREAARLTLSDLERGQEWSPHIETLLRHLDNDLGRAENLLVDMLRRRDQWLRHLVGVRHASEAALRGILETSLQNAIQDALEKARAAIPAGDVAELMQLVRFAAGNVAHDAPLAQCLDLTSLPPAKAEALPQWLAIVDLLLKRDGEWRKSVTTTQGFPALSTTKNQEEKTRIKEMKGLHKALVSAWAESEAVRQPLVAVAGLPAARYGEGQWDIVAALCELLVMAVAHLRLVFASHGQVDFGEIAQSALAALGEEESPTDLALALDYRISHLLVDEFQDTSSGQFQLLKRLTAGWQSGDGRTLFLVGDPMQSIYRFREAEVGLYLKARDDGIGDVVLEPLTLSVNFRSQRGVVDWVNQTFRQILPPQHDVAAGAVAYSASEAFHAAGPGEAVVVHPAVDRDAAAEAEQVAAIVAAAQRRHPEGTTAILVRGRSHLAEIVPALRAARLRFRAIDIERLDQRPVVQDLLSLTRALLHPADRVAWLACLRAPWCGLTLVDLEKLVADDARTTVWDLLSQPHRIEAMSAAGQQRLSRVVAVLGEALRMRRRRGLRAWLEATWLALGGPACVKDETDLEDAEVFFKLINSLDRSADLGDVSTLDERLQKLFALPDVEADDRLQLMTVHKSKGLEFDTVILPGLHRGSRHDDSPLLMWMERVNAAGEADLMLAPVKAVGGTMDPIYRYLRDLDKAKGRFELGRLFYVAATRAKQQLHLLGQVAFDTKKERPRPPLSGSLLGLLWPQVEALFERCPVVEADQQSLPLVAPADRALLHRLDASWQLPQSCRGVNSVASDTLASQQVEQQSTGLLNDPARHVGTVVHLWLQQIAEEGVAHWGAERVVSDGDRFRDELQRLGVDDEALEASAERVADALQAALEDERGRWILSDHEDAHCEYELTGVDGGQVVNLVLDRVFIDEEGVRWIIDYKTSSCNEDDLELFMDAEQEKYRPQLERYAAFMQQLENRPVAMALYFPLVRGWRQWSLD